MRTIAIDVSASVSLTSHGSMRLRRTNMAEPERIEVLLGGKESLGDPKKLVVSLNHKNRAPHDSPQIRYSLRQITIRPLVAVNQTYNTSLKQSSTVDLL